CKCASATWTRKAVGTESRRSWNRESRSARSRKSIRNRGEPLKQRTNDRVRLFSTSSAPCPYPEKKLSRSAIATPAPHLPRGDRGGRDRPQQRPDHDEGTRPRRREALRPRTRRTPRSCVDRARWGRHERERASERPANAMAAGRTFDDAQTHDSSDR